MIELKAADAREQICVSHGSYGDGIAIRCGVGSVNGFTMHLTKGQAASLRDWLNNTTTEEKSRCEESKASDAFVSDVSWTRIVLALPELCDAIREDAVEAKVRAVMRPVFGQLECFQPLVADATRSVLASIATKIGANVPGDMVVLLSSKRVEELEALVKKNAARSSYWIGENVNIEDTKEK